MPVQIVPRFFERVVRDRSAAGVDLFVDAGLGGTLGRVSRQIAVRNEVSIVVRPRPRRGELDVVTGLTREAAKNQRLPEDVLAEVDFERRPSVAE